MEFLYKLQEIRMPWLTKLMLILTELGGETVFLVLALIVFWCVDKRRGYYMMTVGFIGTVCNQFMKLFCRIPRPWVLDPAFTPVEEALEGASGYSFPSGHSQSAAGTYGSLAVTEKRGWLRMLYIAALLLVPFTRMYLGVHTPADVLAGAAISLALVFILQPLVYRKGGMKWAIAVMVLLAVSYAAYVFVSPFLADVDPVILASSRKNAATLFGCVTAVAVVYPAERRWVKFSNNAVWWAQILKVVGGLALVLAVKEGLKAPLEAIAPVLAARAVRYFLLVVMAGLIWPISFRWIEKLGRKQP